MNRQDQYLWDPQSAPDPEVAELERALRPYRHRAVPLPALQTSTERDAQPLASPTRKRLYGFWFRVRVSGLAAAAIVLGALAYRSSREPTPWSVNIEAGTLALAPAGFAPGARLDRGDTIATGDGARARLRVGEIGDVFLSPNTELALVDDGATGHRMSLHHGELHARVWAPPRFFIVDTPSAAAVDLGCIYTLKVDSTGAGALAVLYGSVELASHGRRVEVLANYGAWIAPDGPGVPWPLNSSLAFRTAAQALYMGSGSASELERVLREASSRNTLTLWHLIPRADTIGRVAIVRRLAELVPLPDDASESSIIALEPAALSAWERALRAQWPIEASTWWRRAMVRLGIIKPSASLKGFIPSGAKPAVSP